MYDYAINVIEDVGSFWSSCDDIPEAHSAGDTFEQLLHNAAEGLEVALSIYVDQLRHIPQASPPKEGQRVIHLSALVNAKIALWNAMRDKGMRKADLCRLLNAAQTKVDRLLDFEHSSKIEQVESALAALGKRLAVSVEAA